MGRPPCRRTLNLLHANPIYTDEVWALIDRQRSQLTTLHPKVDDPWQTAMRRHTPGHRRAGQAGAPVSRIAMAMALARLQIQTPWSNGNNNIFVYNGPPLAAGTNKLPGSRTSPRPLDVRGARGMICTEVQRERLPHRSRRPR